MKSFGGNDLYFADKVSLAEFLETVRTVFLIILMDRIKTKIGNTVRAVGGA